MTLKRRIYLLICLLALSMAGPVAVVLMGLREERTLFNQEKELLEGQQLLREITYFFHRHNRAVLSFIMLLEDAERLQVSQTQDVLTQKLDAWDGWLHDTGAKDDALKAVRAGCLQAGFARFQVMNMMDQGLRLEAMKKAEKEFLAASAAAAETLKAATVNLNLKNSLLTDDIARTVERGRWLFAAGFLATAFFALLISRTIRRAMIVPVGSSAGHRAVPRRKPWGPPPSHPPSPLRKMSSME